MEEKYSKAEKPAKGVYGDKYDEDSESSNDESEDDDGVLVDEKTDAQISALLQALKNKTSDIYNEKVKFFDTGDVENEESTPVAKSEKQKPMFLKDYHRETLLKGDATDEQTPPITFAQEQEDLKRTVVQEMHAAAELDGSDDDEDGGFLIPKAKPVAASQGLHPSRARKLEAVDVAAADEDPETFLSNFNAARAWQSADGAKARFQSLESDDEEEDERAEQWEAAYNLRFEDPSGSNEKLKAYSREAVTAKSVRREEPNSRKKKRDSQREKKDAEKAEREEERARLRRLKIDEMEAKVQKIKKAAGIKGKTLQIDDWSKILDEAYDDENWDAEITAKHFGEDYYAEQEGYSESDEEGTSKKRKVKKPKWDDDIDITDLVPEFVEEEKVQAEPTFVLSDVEEDYEEDGEDGEVAEGTSRKSKTSKDRQQEKAAKKKAARLERKRIEELVDSRLDIDLPLKSKQSAFRYRETSPTHFGLTPRDILMASDTSLNQFAGLKKLATFREPDKKSKDKKRLNKKARNKWRKETFGGEEEPEFVFAPSKDEAALPGNEGLGDVNIVEGKKKKKRSRRSKAGQDEI